MRILQAILALAALAIALPSDNLKAAEAEVKARTPEPEPFDDAPILDARIDAHEKEGRTVNLSPHNNRMGKCLPSV
ncbi:hypothetical protein MFIFM68171_07134 [Madurella fahalii]|uniref:Uncharacterized protein n=1 Tax=Madurella fahalii TaxID=1157608 RepID=A0ABQ0GGR1_9PEZI